MRTLLVLSIIATAFFSPMAATKADAQCLLCGMVGFAIGSSSNDNQAGASSGGNVMYVAPHIEDRIADPLAVRMAASERLNFSEMRDLGANRAKHMTLQEVFKKTVPNHENFTILEIARVIKPGSNYMAVFWFAYIENEKMRPLSELPSD